jgi:hypothetical protein
MIPLPPLKRIYRLAKLEIKNSKDVPFPHMKYHKAA